MEERIQYFKELKQVRKSSEYDVFEGRHILTKKLAILKVIKQNVLEEGIPASIIREISFMKELDHPNIVCLQSVYVDRMSVSLLYDYVRMDLRTYNARLPTNYVFPHAVIQSYLYQIVNAIAFCHQRRIFHRNLCPQSVLITQKGNIKLSDFDAARSYEVTRKIYTQNISSVLCYRAPELLLGTSQYTPKIDVWSIGCIFAELFLRKPLFQAESEIGQLLKIFEVLGTPTKINWPEVEKMPYYFSGLPIKTTNNLRSIVKGANNIEMHLMKQMFRFNPVDRIAAKHIMNHQYFTKFNKNLRIPTIL